MGLRKTFASKEKGQRCKTQTKAALLEDKNRNKLRKT